MAREYQSGAISGSTEDGATWGPLGQWTEAVQPGAWQGCTCEVLVCSVLVVSCAAVVAHIFGSSLTPLQLAFSTPARPGDELRDAELEHREATEVLSFIFGQFS